MLLQITRSHTNVSSKIIFINARIAFVYSNLLHFKNICSLLNEIAVCGPIFFYHRFFLLSDSLIMGLKVNLAYELMDFTVNESMVYVLQLIHIFLN
jgi:hypothetical protein